MGCEFRGKHVWLISSRSLHYDAVIGEKAPTVVDRLFAFIEPCRNIRKVLKRIYALYGIVTSSNDAFRSSCREGNWLGMVSNMMLQ